MAEEFEGTPQDGDEYKEGDDLNTPEPKDELVETVINGETFMVKPEMAEALKKQETPKIDTSHIDSKIDSLDQKIESLKTKPEQEDNLDDFFEDPFKYLNQMRTEVKDEISNELRQEYVQDKSQESFWNEFYSENEDLKGAETLVDAVLSRNSNKLADMSISQAKSELADLTRKEILKFVPKGTQTSQFVEGGKEKSPPKVEKEQKVVTLGDIIKNRRTNRRKARGGQ